MVGVQPIVTDDQGEFLAALGRDGAVVFDCTKLLQEEEAGSIWAGTDGAADPPPSSYQRLASRLPLLLLGEALHLASLAPTQIKMKAEAATGVAKPVTYGLEQQGKGSCHLKGGAVESKSKTTNLTIDPLHSDGAKACGLKRPDVIFLLCEEPCPDGGANFVVDGAALANEFAREEAELGEGLAAVPVEQVYYSVTAMGKSVVTGPLAVRFTPGGAGVAPSLQGGGQGAEQAARSALEQATEPATGEATEQATEQAPAPAGDAGTGNATGAEERHLDACAAAPVLHCGATRLLVHCPNVFEGEEGERVRPCAASADPARDLRMIQAFAGRMRRAQAAAPRFALPHNCVLVCDNARVWHGREPFFSLGRCLWRVWAWTREGNGLPEGVKPGVSNTRDCEV